MVVVTGQTPLHWRLCLARHCVVMAAVSTFLNMTPVRSSGAGKPIEVLTLLGPSTAICGLLISPQNRRWKHLALVRPHLNTVHYLQGASSKYNQQGSVIELLLGLDMYKSNVTDGFPLKSTSLKLHCWASTTRYIY